VFQCAALTVSRFFSYIVVNNKQKSGIIKEESRWRIASEREIRRETYVDIEDDGDSEGDGDVNMKGCKLLHS
jgi:hypothetical protein